MAATAAMSNRSPPTGVERRADVNPSTLRRPAVLAAAACVLLNVAAPARAAFPGRNGAIAFDQSTGSGDLTQQFVEHRRLALVSSRGGPARALLDCVLTDGAPTGGDCTATQHRTPSWSPDGRRMLFDAGDRLALVDANGRNLVLLPPASRDDGDPVFAPDGRRIAFSGANARGTTDLYVLRLGAPAARVIVYDAGEPAWSARNVLAYVRSGNVYTARADGRRRRFVTSGVSPDWSPDGRRLALVRPLPSLVYDGPTGRMYLVGSSGRGVRRVGRATNVSHPAWSPDGRWLAYDGFDLGVQVTRLGSRAARELAPTQSSGSSGSIASSDPAWRPLR
jgi:dipeptidyl aminopeptidase/acylaminoacyl peptidase